MKTHHRDRDKTVCDSKETMQQRHKTDMFVKRIRGKLCYYYKHVRNVISLT